MQYIISTWSRFGILSLFSQKKKKKILGAFLQFSYNIYDQSKWAQLLYGEIWKRHISYYICICLLRRITGDVYKKIYM